MLIAVMWVRYVVLTSSVVSAGTEQEVRDSVELSSSGAFGVQSLFKAEDHQGGNRQGGSGVHTGRTLPAGDSGYDADDNSTRHGSPAPKRRSSTQAPRRTSTKQVDFNDRQSWGFDCRDDWNQDIPRNWGGSVHGGSDEVFESEVNNGAVVPLKQEPEQRTRGGAPGSWGNDGNWISGQYYYCIHNTQRIMDDHKLYVVCADYRRISFYDCKFRADFFEIEEEWREEHANYTEWFPFEFTCSIRCLPPDRGPRGAYRGPTGGAIGLPAPRPAPVVREERQQPKGRRPSKFAAASPLRATEAYGVSDRSEFSDDDEFSDRSQSDEDEPDERRIFTTCDPQKCDNKKYVRLGPLKDGLLKPECHCTGLVNRIFPYPIISSIVSISPFLYTYAKKNFLS